MGPTLIAVRIDAIGPTADPSIDDGASSLSVRNGVLDGFIMDERFGIGFSGTWHGLTSCARMLYRGERLVYTSGSDRRVRSKLWVVVSFEVWRMSKRQRILVNSLLSIPENLKDFSTPAIVSGRGTINLLSYSPGLRLKGTWSSQLLLV